MSTNWCAPLKDLKITPELRDFVRDRLAWARICAETSGAPLSPGRIKQAIEQEDRIPGNKIGEATIDRFLKYVADSENPHLSREQKQKARDTTIISLIGFLLEFDYASLSEIQAQGRRSPALAGLSLAQFYPETDPHYTNLKGHYEYYMMVGSAQLMQLTLIIGSPDQQILTTVIRRTLYSVADFLDFVAPRELIANHDFKALSDLIHDEEIHPQNSSVANGIFTLTKDLGFIAFGDRDALFYGLWILSERHQTSETTTGLLFESSQSWTSAITGHRADTSSLPPVALFGQWLPFYPQNIAGTVKPKFASVSPNQHDISSKGGVLNFARNDMANMCREDQMTIAMEEQDIAFQAAWLDCKTPTEKLALALDWAHNQAALEALDLGADVDSLHPDRKLPLMHMIAGLGMEDVIEFILQQGTADLTIKDQFGRLPSSCADRLAHRPDLRDRLAEAQIRQFQAKGLDPWTGQPITNAPQP